MLWTSELSPKHRITQLNCRIQDNQSVLTWLWPEGIQMVYVYRFNPDEQEPPLGQRRMKLYTREEYKSHAGFWDRVEGFGRYGYRVYPCLKQPEGVTAILQEDEDNLLLFSAGRAAIRYSVKYGNAFFGRMRKARIEIVSEVPVSKEALCYVKKEGSTPLHKDDGIAYPFIQDIAAGRNMFPEIEISRGSQLRIFFTDGKKYGDIYELIPM